MNGPIIISFYVGTEKGSKYGSPSRFDEQKLLERIRRKFLPD